MMSPTMRPCDCEKEESFGIPHETHSYKSKKPLAMAYVPWQSFENVFDGHDGLNHGSIFGDLVLPFEGKKAACSYCGENKPQKLYDGRDYL